MIEHVFIISDGTGNTAQQALKAALIQFESTEVETHVRPNVCKKKQVLDIIIEAHNIKAMIIHTVVSKKLRHFIHEQGRLYELRTIDLMGPLLAQLSHHFHNSPTEKPGLFHKYNRAYFQRIEAIEFALRHDDGQRTEELDKADIVLLGVSRTFKTPLSVYMAYKGWSVANIPIIYGVKIPEIVYKIPPKRVFCLSTVPNRLAVLRQARHIHLGGLTGDYSKHAHVQKELNYALGIFRSNPKWTIIKVTYKPIEEISSEILAHIRRK